MTEASDNQCCDRRKRNIDRVTSSTSLNINRQKLNDNRFIYSIPPRIPHTIFRHFPYHEKSFSGYSKKYLQFQDESDEESMRANLQTSRASCSSRLQIAQSKLPIKIPTLRRKFARLRAKEHPVKLTETN